jgi:hypothetical protein
MDLEPPAQRRRQELLKSLLQLAPLHVLSVRADLKVAAAVNGPWPIRPATTASAAP